MSIASPISGTIGIVVKVKSIIKLMKGSEKTRGAGISPEVTPANILRRLSIRPISAKQDQTQFPVNLPPPYSSHSLLKPSTGAWKLLRYRQYNRLSTSSNWMSEQFISAYLEMAGKYSFVWVIVIKSLDKFKQNSAHRFIAAQNLR